MRSFDQYVTDEELAHRRQFADELRADPEKFRRYQAEARRQLAEGDARQAHAEGKREQPRSIQANRWWLTISAAVVIAITAIITNLRSQRRKQGVLND
jgi:hypothetical protein